jgi:hypothetical protein
MFGRIDWRVWAMACVALGIALLVVALVVARS